MSSFKKLYKNIVFSSKLPLEFDPIVRGVNTCRLLRFSFPSFLFFFFFQLLFFTCADRKVHVAFFRFQCHFGMLTFTVSKEIFRCPNTYYAKICNNYEKDKFCFVCFQPDLSSTEKFWNFSEVWGLFFHIFTDKTNKKLEFLYIVVSWLRNWLT